MESIFFYQQRGTYERIHAQQRVERNRSGYLLACLWLDVGWRRICADWKVNYGDGMGILNPNFRYTNAADSAKPGYLRRKFERIRREQREAEEAEKRKLATVRQIKGMK